MTSLHTLNGELRMVKAEHATKPPCQGNCKGCKGAKTAMPEPTAVSDGALAEMPKKD